MPPSVWAKAKARASDACPGESAADHLKRAKRIYNELRKEVIPKRPAASNLCRAYNQKEVILKRPAAAKVCNVKHQPAAFAQVTRKRPSASVLTLCVPGACAVGNHATNVIPAKRQRLEHAPTNRTHYDILGVPSDASAASVKLAFKKRVLVTHPDKGGSDDACREVIQAFAVLSDPVKRKQYNLKHGFGDVCHESNSTSACQHSDVVRSFLAMLRVSSPASWRQMLGALSQDLVVGLAAFIQHPTKKAQMGVGASKMRMNIVSSPTGYNVKVGWACFYIQTGSPVPSLEHALEICAAAIEVKNLAATRLAMEDGEPMTRTEHDHLLKSTRLYPLLFDADIQKGGLRIQTPATPCFETALSWRRRAITFLQQHATKAQWNRFKKKRVWKRFKETMREEASKQRCDNRATLGELRAFIETAAEPGSNDGPPKSLTDQPLWAKEAVAEAYAARKLQKGKISYPIVLKLLRYLPVPDGTHRKNILLDEGSKHQSMCFGLYWWSGSLGITGATRRMPSVMKLLAKFVSQHDPCFKFTSVQVNKSASAPHVDSNNLGPSKIIALGKFRGGRLWIHSDTGDVECKIPERFSQKHAVYKPGQAYRGKFVNVHQTFYTFDGNVLHFTEKVEGERYSLVYFTNDKLAAAPPEVHTELANFGAPLDDLRSSYGGA